MLQKGCIFETCIKRQIINPVMRKFLTLFFLSLGIWAAAQPVNDDCAGLIDLGIAPFCSDTTFFYNDDATASDIGNDNVPSIGDCGGLGPMQRDVWFQFIASDTIEDYRITVTGIQDDTGSTAMIMPQFAIYRGDCEFDGLELLDCAAAEIDGSVATIDVTGLDAGLPYFIRITDYSTTAASNEGSFIICIEQRPPIIELCDDFVTDLCIGDVYDCGGPDGDYEPNSNYTLTITPPGPNVGCITFTLEYYNIDLNSDAITFYDGPSTSSPQISQLTGGGFGGGDGGGAVCYTVTATSGSLTMQFQSDGNLEFEGFHGFWECSEGPCDPTELITVDATVDTTDIVDAVASPQTQVTITDINCPEGSYGTFEAGDFTDLGLERGLILTSGGVENAGFGNGVANPGNVFASTSNGAPGDPDLDYLSTLGNGQPSNDACILELDVFVATDELTFEYVFGSEEYPEFVNSSFNDIFAFFISGPGIMGDPNLTNNAENIAVLPDPINVPVEINSVNNQLNWEYYRTNLDGQSVVYDGLTSDFLGVKKSLTAFSEVIPCTTYHLKLAIADRGDFSFDSGVFVSEIKGGTPVLGVNYQNGIEYLVEDCTDQPDEIIIGLSSPQEEETTYDVVIGGTAELGVDYTLNIPSEITFAAGETEFTFPITPITDGITEGTETITITLTNDFGCGVVDLAQIVIELYDDLNVEIFAGADTAVVCSGGSIQMEVSGAQSYFWSPTSIFDDQFSETPIATPANDITVFVVGQLGLCLDVDSVFLDVVDPEVTIITSDPTGICQGDSVTLTAVNNVFGAGLQWSPAGAVPDPNATQITVAPLFNQTYTVGVELEGCQDSDQITIEVDPFDFPVLNFTDTTICQNYPVTLAQDIPFTTTVFDWQPDDGSLDDNTLPNPTAIPNVTTTYTLIATSQNAFCADTAEVEVTVIPADMEIVEPAADTAFICLGESVNIEVNSTTNGVGMQWFPDDGSLSSTTDEDVVATPIVSTQYVGTLTVGACVIFDSLYVKVDSLPFNGITELIPDKESYCEGEIITITSPTYEPANFPDITHQWVPDQGLQSPDSLWNLVIQATEPLTFIRFTENNACVDTAEIFIEVIPTSSVSIEPGLTTICIGDTVQLEAISPDSLSNYSWTPSNSLSCADCPNPLAFPTSSTTYTVEGEFSGCPVEASGTVEVNVYPPTNLQDQIICVGGSAILNGEPGSDPDAEYEWSANGNVISTEVQPIVSPNQTTIYTLSLTVPGCDPQIQTVTVTVINEPPVLTISQNATICIGDQITLEASLDIPGGEFLWSNGEETPTITVQPGETTTYTVVVDTDCFTLTDSVTVNVSPGFTLDSLLAEPIETFEGSPVVLTAFTTPPTLLDPLYTWSVNGDSLGSGINLNPFTTTAPSVDADGTSFTYEVLIVDAVGCSETDTVNVIVNDSKYEIPNIFTPDGDGTNDFFNIVRNEAVEIVDFKIYNRWGQTVYDNDDNQNGWDGTQNGEPAPMDVYVFKALLRFGDDTEILEEGQINLIR
jgi:gliding motility-associated-like protein